MKRLLFLLILLTGCAHVNSHKYVAPSTAVTKVKIEAAQKSNTKAEVLIQKARVKLTQLPTNTSPAVKDIDKLLVQTQMELKTQHDTLVGALAENAKVQTANDQLALQANQLNDKNNKLVAEHNKDLGIIWRYRSIVIALGVVAVGFVAFKFGLFHLI